MAFKAASDKITHIGYNKLSATITCSVDDIFCVTSLGNDDMGADDCEAALLCVSKWTIDGEENKTDLNLLLPADAFKDAKMMEHVMSVNKDAANELELTEDFNDLMHQNFKKRTATGGLSLF